MIAQLLWILASVVMLALASMHLYFTFFSNKFSIRSAEVEQGMKNTHPVLTNKISVWNAWIGFNGSHSSGIIFMAAIHIYLAACQYELLSHSVFIQALTLVTSLFLVFLGKKYWFNVPFTGAVIAFVCYTLAVCFMWI